MRQRALYLPLRQEHVQVSVLHVFSHHAQRVGRHAHTQQPDDVGVVQTGHDLNFLQEVVPDGQIGEGRGDIFTVSQTHSVEVLSALDRLIFFPQRRTK